MSNFQCVWRYSCLNATFKNLTKVWRKDKWPTDCICWLCKWSQQNATVQSKCSKIPPSTSMHFSTLLTIVRVALLRSSWRSCFIRAAKSQCERQIRLLCLFFLCRLRFSSIPTDKNLICTRQLQKSVSSHPLEIERKIFTIPPETSCIYM